MHRVIWKKNRCKINESFPFGELRYVSYKHACITVGIWRLNQNLLINGMTSHVTEIYTLTVFTEINAHPEISAHQRQSFFKGGSTQNRWALMGDFSKGGVHKTDGLWWVIFQRGEYTKPMGFDGWFFKGGSTQNRWALMGDFSKGGVHKTDGLWWVLEFVLMLLKIKRPGRLFRQIQCMRSSISQIVYKIFGSFLFPSSLSNRTLLLKMKNEDPSQLKVATVVADGN